jgi:DNA polymerase III delta prime subunit
MSASISETFISKYKPYSLKTFCMNPKTKSALETLFLINDLNILFIGDTGLGKTTVLYCLLRDYYGLSKTDNLPETNIMFINNLKEQGIHFYRNEMKTFCQSHSSILNKKKVIVVDDLDNINEQSQQVFRNYIDKYKKNVHFISVCSNLNKIIDSIQSRLHLIPLYQPDETQIRHIMTEITTRENILLDSETEQYILSFSNNNIRILIQYLEKIAIIDRPINIDLCKNICSNISFQYFDQYITKLQNRRISEAIAILYNIHDYGYSVIDIFDYFFTYIKTTSLISEDVKYKIIPFLCKYITIFHNIHEDVIELTFFTNHLSKIII